MYERLEVATQAAELEPSQFYENNLAPLSSNRNSLVLILMGLRGLTIGDYQSEDPMTWASDELWRAGLVTNRYSHSASAYRNCDSVDFAIYRKQISHKGRGLIPLAGELLDFSRRNQIDVKNILCDVGSSLREQETTSQRIDLLRKLRESEGQQRVADIDTISNPSNYSSGLFTLRQAGLATIELVRIEDGMPGNSMLEINDQQREIITDFLSVVDGFVDGDQETIDHGMKSAKTFAESPNLFNKVTELDDGRIRTYDILTGEFAIVRPQYA